MSTSSKTPPPAPGSSAPLNPAIIAGITFIVGIGLGWAGATATGGGSGRSGGGAGSAGAAGGAGPGSSSYAQMNSGAAAGEDGAPGTAATAGAPEQIATPETKIFTAEADQLFKKLLDQLEAGEELNGMELATRIQQLKDMGEEGFRVMADFLKTNEDFELQGGRGPGQRASTLRMALLQALQGETSETAKQANLYVMQSSPYISEVAMAARNLEGGWSGEYTAQVQEQMRSLISNLGKQTDMTEDQLRREGWTAMDYIARNPDSAGDLMPIMEGLVAQAGGREVGGLIWGISRLPPAAQAESFVRMASNPETAKKLAENGGAIPRLDMSSETTQNAVLPIYNQMNTREQEEFLEGFRGGRRGGGWGRGRGRSNDVPAEQQIASTEGSIKVLQQITPTTPVQTQLHGEALQSLNNRLNRLRNPSTE